VLQSHAALRCVAQAASKACSSRTPQYVPLAQTHHHHPRLTTAPQIKRSQEGQQQAGMLRRSLQRCAPLLTSANKRRFFQLSADLTTLRWAWNKYVLLFYVEEVVPRDEELSITLVLTMEADLVLGFTVGGGAGWAGLAGWWGCVGLCEAVWCWWGCVGLCGAVWGRAQRKGNSVVVEPCGSVAESRASTGLYGVLGRVLCVAWCKHLNVWVYGCARAQQIA
jgi:hypothetical protein